MATGRGTSSRTQTNVAYKIVLLGDPSCGKTSIINRYTENTFKSTYVKGIAGGQYYREHTLSLNNESVTIHIYDTVGQDDKRILNTTIFRKVHGIMLVFDVSREKTLNSIPAWIDVIKTNVTPYDPEIILVGNKSDIPQEQRPNLAEDMRQTAREIARNSDVPYIEVSARRNHYVKTAFETLLKKITPHNRRLHKEITRHNIQFDNPFVLQPKSEDTSSCCF